LAFHKTCNIYCCRFLQPLCLKQFLEYYNPEEETITKQQAYLLALALISLNLLRVLYFHQFNLEFSSLGMKVRVACSSLMYRKYLTLKKGTCQKFTLGQMVNLLSNDVDRFLDVFPFLHYIWIGLLKLVVGIYYFNVILGNTVTIGFLIFFLFFILQGLSFSVVRPNKHNICFSLFGAARRASQITNC
jgi:ATP-binding cassette subfamily C (CFTR/MRP) protein 4